MIIENDTKSIQYFHKIYNLNPNHMKCDFCNSSLVIKTIHIKPINHTFAVETLIIQLNDDTFINTYQCFSIFQISLSSSFIF